MPRILVLLTTIIIASLPITSLSQLAITNVTGSQRPDDSRMVDIRYDLVGATGTVSVVLVVSTDNGETWTVVPRFEFLSGDFGFGVPIGSNRHIVWDVLADRPGEFWPNAIVRIIAAPDGDTPDDSLTIMLPGEVPLELVLIPSGVFEMGAPPDERGRFPSEGPLTTVIISRDFYMGKYEVTQAQWLALMGSWPDEAPSALYGVGPEHPAYFVSWHDTQDYIAALNAHISATGQGPADMRLPTEAEWEYAARADTDTRFYFGDSLTVGDFCEDDGDRGDNMWYCGNADDQAHPVGLKLPNAFGLYDMLGNISEWVLNWDAGLHPGGIVSNPSGPSTGSYRVLRGGSWAFTARGCRSAVRDAQNPTFRNEIWGFRLLSYRGDDPLSPKEMNQQKGDLEGPSDKIDPTVMGDSESFVIDTRIAATPTPTSTPIPTPPFEERLEILIDSLLGFTPPDFQHDHNADGTVDAADVQSLTLDQ